MELLKALAAALYGALVGGILGAFLGPVLLVLPIGVFELAGGCIGGRLGSNVMFAVSGAVLAGLLGALPFATFSRRAVRHGIFMALLAMALMLALQGSINFSSLGFHPFTCLLVAAAAAGALAAAESLRSADGFWDLVTFTCDRRASHRG